MAVFKRILFDKTREIIQVSRCLIYQAYFKLGINKAQMSWLASECEMRL